MFNMIEEWKHKNYSCINISFIEYEKMIHDINPDVDVKYYCDGGIVYSDGGCQFKSQNEINKLVADKLGFEIIHIHADDDEHLEENPNKDMETQIWIVYKEPEKTIGG